MKIAIIGGGAAGISVMDTFIRHSAVGNQHAALTLIEPNKQVGPGRAYEGDGDYALLNQRARFMSIRADKPSHFIDWIRSEIGPEVAEEEFVPRSLFGSYLTAQFHRQIKTSRDLNSPISVVSATASAMYRDDRKIRIVTAQGESLKFDAAVLCIGTAEPTDVFDLSGSPGFISEPYPIWLTCAGIRAQEHVAVLGSSLTAMDTVLGLLSQKHSGRITLLSRRGLLPAVRQPHCEFAFRRLSQDSIAGCLDNDGFLNIHRLLELVKSEFEAQSIPFSFIEAEFVLLQSAMTRLRRHLSQIEKSPFWQPLFIKIANHFVEFAWQHVSESDRRSFLKLYHPLFMSLCNPMPPKTARTVAKLIEENRVAIAHGVESVEPKASGGFVVSARNNRFHVDRVINASRPERAGIGRLGKPLVKSLVGAGDAQINPHGGVKVDPMSLRILRRDGRPNRQIFAVGQLTAGDFYYTGSLSVITRQIERMTPHLLALTRTEKLSDV